MNVGTRPDHLFLATLSSQLAHKRLPPVDPEAEFTRRAKRFTQAKGLREIFFFFLKARLIIRFFLQQALSGVVRVREIL